MKRYTSLQKKRKAPKSSGFRMIHAATGNRKKKKQRAATASAEDFGGEVPGVGVARALVVIALLHVVAIGGIWLHNNWSKENALQRESTVSSAKPVAKNSVLLVPGGKHYFVETGDNYFNIARKNGVDMQELKSANNLADLSPGLKINIPPRQMEATTPSQSVVGERKAIVRIEPEQEQVTIRPVERPVIQPNGHETIPVSRPATIVQVESTPPAQAAERPENKPLLIKPRVSHNTPPARAEVIRETVTMKTHTISKGDTIWGLSRKYGVSTKSIMSANGISDASKIRLGAQLKIPAN